MPGQMPRPNTQMAATAQAAPRAAFKYTNNICNPQQAGMAQQQAVGVVPNLSRSFRLLEYLFDIFWEDSVLYLWFHFHAFHPLQAVHVQGQDPLTASMLAQAPLQEQKQMLGERLFPLIQGMYPELAGKITGMLLEIDNSELLHMLESRESLKAKVRGITWSGFIWWLLLLGVECWAAAFFFHCDELNWTLHVLQVEEAVAVLQAHQAKEAASAQAK